MEQKQYTDDGKKIQLLWHNHIFSLKLTIKNLISY